MRRIIIAFTTVLYKLIYVLNKSIDVRCNIYKTKLISRKKNHICLAGIETCNTDVSIDGNNNELLSEGLIQHTSITVIGNGNKIIFKQGSKIQKTIITIRANNASVIIGENSNILSATFICQGNENYIHVGKNCLFSANVELWNSDTHTIYDSEGNIINHSKPITIGDHVWIGKHVKVLKGVTIGEHSVIGMCSLVTKDIAPSTINAGAPCKTIKHNVNWSNDKVDI